MKLITSDELMPTILDMVKRAEKKVQIASAWIKGKSFVEIFNFLSNKNLEIEVIFRTAELQDLLITDEEVFRIIKNAGGRIYFSKRLHAKFMIVDGKEALVGSANFTDAGLSDLSTGNIEAGVYYNSLDEVKRLEEYFKSIKNNHSETIQDNVVGFALNPVRIPSFEFICLDDVEINSYVEIKSPEGTILGRVKSVNEYDLGFFINPFSSSDLKIFAPFEDFLKIFSAEKDNEWKMAAVYAYRNKNRNNFRIASAEIYRLINEDGILDMPRKPFEVGSPIYKASDQILNQVLKKAYSGFSMSRPIKVGKLKGTDMEVFIDAEEVLRKHMLIIGTTGSGKSYFTKGFLITLLNSYPVQVFILDPHGEYYEALVERFSEDEIEHIIFEDVIFPVRYDEVIELIKEAGFDNLVSGNANIAKNNQSILRKYIKNSLNLTKFSEMNLLQVIEELEVNKVDDLEEIKNYLSDTYGESAITGQKGVYEDLIRGIKSPKNIVIFNFKNITFPSTRVNLAGLILKAIFFENKKEPRERVIVLEEAHNFAPEKGVDEVKAGSDNLSLNYTKKIASEGRKFNLGLITITQRPAQVSKFVLSQMNTQVMFRTINASDLDAVSTYIESAGEDIIGTLPMLPLGNCIISGLGVPFPLFVEVK